MLFNYYLKEVKYRFLYCISAFLFNFIILLYFSKELLFILVKPLLLINKNGEFYYFIFTNMSDVLLLYVKIALLLSAILIIPKILIQTIIFLLQGLYNHEKKFIFLCLGFFISCFYSITVLLYFYGIPIIWAFFVNFELTSIDSLFGMYYEAKINDYIDFMFFIFFVFCSFLQIPLLMIFIIYFNLIPITFFIHYRKYFIIIFFILGGFFSPPDIFSQVFIALTVLTLYEVILFFSLLVQNYIK